MLFLFYITSFATNQTFFQRCLTGEMKVIYFHLKGFTPKEIVYIYLTISNLRRICGSMQSWQASHWGLWHSWFLRWSPAAGALLLGNSVPALIYHVMDAYQYHSILLWSSRLHDSSEDDLSLEDGWSHTATTGSQGLFMTHRVSSINHEEKCPLQATWSPHCHWPYVKALLFCHPMGRSDLDSSSIHEGSFSICLWRPG